MILVDIFQWCHNFFYLEVFLSSDSLTQTNRKLIFSYSVIVWVVLFFQQLFQPSAYQKDWENTLANAADSLCFIVAIPVLYVAMRRQKRVSDNLMLGWVVMGYVAFLFDVLRYATSGAMLYIPALMTTAIASYVPYMGKVIAAGMMLLLLNMYNLVALGYKTNYPVLMFATSWSDRSSCFHFNEVSAIVRVSVILAMVLIIKNQTSTLLEKLKEEQRNFALAKTVADHLSRYDTNKAKEALEEAAATDSDFTESLRIIVQNMEAHRPYLPNYLFRTNQGSMGPGNEVVPFEETESGASEDVMYRSPLVPAVTQAFAQAEISAQHRTISVASVNYEDIFQRTKNDSSFFIGQEVLGFIDMIFDAAERNVADVHSFLGDRVFLSWNATTRCLNHELKAVTTLMELRSKLPHIELCGTAATEYALCQLGGTKTIACLIHSAPLFGQLKTLMQVATKARTIVCTSRIAEQVEHSVNTQGIDAAIMDVTTDTIVHPQIMIIHEILSMFCHATDHQSHKEEWMYRTRKDQTPVTESLHIALNGDVDQAMEMLEVFLSASCGPNAGGTYLLRKLRNCSTGIESFPTE
eukprot:PhF_6_TR42788/c0_g1_i1/m.64740